jgi:hypothetical protein
MADKKKKDKWKENSNKNWENDSVFQSKDPGKQYMTGGKNWLDYFYEDQANKQKEAVADAASGQINYKEAAKTSRVKYTTDNYQGKSKDDKYKWEENLSDLKFKGARSNNDKFKEWAKIMGLTEGQAEDFRNFLDFQEDSVAPGPKLKKDKTVDQRSSVPQGQGATTQVDRIDAILNQMTKNIKTSTDYQNSIADYRAQEDADIAKRSEEAFQRRTNKDYVEKDNENEQLKTGNKFADGVIKALEIADRPWDALRSGIKNKAEGSSFLEGAKAGFTGKMNTSGTELNQTFGFDPENNKTDSAIAKILGDIAIGSTGAIGNAASMLVPKDKKDEVRRKIGTETAGMGTEVLLDPLNLLGVGGIAKALRGAGRGAEAVRGAEEAAQASRVAQEIGASPNEAPIPYELKQTMNDFAPDQLPEVGDTSIQEALLDPLFNFGQRGNGPQARGPQQANVARYEKENINNLADNILNQIDQPPTPKNFYNQRVLDVQKAMRDQENTDTFSTVQDAFNQRDALENSFVQRELEPHVANQTQAANAQAKWESVIKQAKDESERIKSTHGKIYVPKGEREDYGIPQQFRASLTDRHSNDIHSFADQEGFSSVDEAVQYLKQIDADSKLRLKDLTPANNRPITEDGWKLLENEARSKFAQSGEADALDQLIADLLDPKSRSNIDALYSRAKGANDPKTFDDLIKLAERENDGQANLLGSLRSDPKIREALNQLNALGRPAGRELPPVNTAPPVGSVDDLLSLLDNPKLQNVNNSQAPEQVLASLISNDKPVSQEAQQITDTFANMGSGFKAAADAERARLLQENGFLEYKNPAAAELFRKQNPTFREEVQSDGSTRFYPPESTPSQAAEEVAADPLLRMNLQHFNEAETNPLINVDGPAQSKTAIETIANPIKRKLNQFYENYVNKNHGFKVAEMQTLMKQVKDAKEAGNHDLAKQLSTQLKNVKRYGSDLEKAVGNEAASSAAAKNFLDNHMSRLAATVGGKPEEVTKALEYQMAKNLDWIRNNGKPDYELPEGWDWERVIGIINAGDARPEYKAFTQEMRNLTQEWRDVMRDYGLVNEEAYKALGENPFYIPMARELNLDNIDAGLAGNAQSARRRSNPGIVHSLHNGDVETFYKNPIETIMKNSFVLFKNAYRNDTAQQAYRLAEMDPEGLFAKVISKKQFDDGGGLEVSLPDGSKKYVRMQPDMMKALKENEQPMDIDNIMKLTRLYSYLKTTSLEYQVTAAPRDMTQAYLTSQIGNPVRYFTEVMKAVKNKNADAKKVGAYFEHAYNEHTAGMDPTKITQEYAKQSGMTVVKDKKSMGELVKTVYDILTTPARKLGQITDDIPRDIEVKETERLFMKKHGQEMQSLQDRLGQIDEQLAQAQGVTDPFDPRLQGIDNLNAEKQQIESQLRQFQQDLKREQVYRGRDVINYSRAGRGGVAKAIRKYVVFANTTTQSKDKVIRSFIERPTQTLIKTMGIVAPFVAAEKMMHDNMSDSDREVYDGLPDYTKQFNYIFVRDGKVIALPKLQELALISNPIEAALKGEDLNDSLRLLAKESVPYQGGMAAQGFVPNEDGSVTPLQNMQFPGTVATPGAEVLGNNKIGFNQKPISFGAHFKGADAEANDWTLDLYKNGLGNNPNADFVQYLTQQYGGDAGKYTNYSLDWLLDRSNSDKLDAMLQNLNPLQDRYYSPDSRYFKAPPQESRK